MGKHTHMYTHTLETWGHTPQIPVLLATYTRKGISTVHAVMSRISIKLARKTDYLGNTRGHNGPEQGQLTQHSMKYV